MRNAFFVGLSLALGISCHQAPTPEATQLANATQLVVVTTAGWDSTAGELRRYSRDDIHSTWRATVEIFPR